MIHTSCSILHVLRGDDRHRHMIYFFLRIVELQYFLKLLEQLSAKTLISKAKSIVSPYFGERELAFAYASA